jgi:hypothetical protein
MKNLYTYKEIRDKINSGDNIKLTTIEKMLRHLLMQYACLEWERDEARKKAVLLRDHYEEGNFLPWEKGKE